MPVPFWAKPTSVALFIATYLLVHFAVRLAMWPTLGLDDAEQALFAQQFSWTYRYRAPPLFTWILVAMGRWIGVDIVSVSLIRYALLGITFAFTYLTARRLIADPRLSALSAYSFVAIYVFGYYSHHDLTHTTALSALVAVAWYVFVRLAASPRPGWYVALGGVVGLGFLSKWNFVMFAAALPLACLVRPGFRHLILTWKVLLSGAVAALLVVPTVLAALRMGPAAGEDLRTVLGSEPAPMLARLGYGTTELAAALIGYPQPLLPLAVAVFAVPLWRGLRGRSLGRGTVALTPDAAFIGWTMAISIALHWALVATLGATEFRERLMQPPLFILPVWLFMLIQRGLPSPRLVTAFAAVLAMLAGATLTARVAIYLRGADHCSTCRAMVPFSNLADGLRAAGFRGRGTILTEGFHVGGNLRVEFPEARVIDVDFPASVWPGPTGQSQCLLAWPVREDQSTAAPPPDLLTYLAGQLGADPAGAHRQDVTSAQMLNSARLYRLGFRLYDAPAGDCR